MDKDQFDDIARKLASRDSRRHFLGTIGTVAGGALGLLRVSKGLARPAGTVGVCHLDDEGVYRYIQVSENAIPAHVSHGDIIAPEFSTDLANCGGCGIACPPAPANGTVACINAQCQVSCDVGFEPDGSGGCVSVCDYGFTDCNGACIDLATDASNCGACGVPCTAPENGTAFCDNGECQHTCNTGFTDCAGACIDLNNDASNCGVCGNACTSGQACIDGACHLPSGAKCYTTETCMTCVNGFGACVCDECTCIWLTGHPPTRRSGPARRGEFHGGSPRRGGWSADADQVSAIATTT